MMWLSSFPRALARFVTRRVGLTLLLSLLAAVGYGRGIASVEFSTAYRVFFPEGDPGLVALTRLEDVFTKTDNVLVVIHDEDGIFQPRALEAVQKATEAGWQFPHASRVDSIANFQHFESTEDDIVQRMLVDKPTPPPSPRRSCWPSRRRR